MPREEFTIRKAGKLIRVDDFEGKNSKITREFLDGLLQKVIESSQRYCVASAKSNKEFDHPLRWPERCMYSVFSSAISQLTPLHLSELGVDRSDRRSRKSRGGRVDFWAQYEKCDPQCEKCDFLLELKRATFSSDINLEKIKANWESVLRQTKGLKKDAKGWSENYVLVGLQVLLAYKTAKKRFDPQSFESRFEKAKRLEKEITESTEFRDLRYTAIWVPPDDMSVFDFDKNGQEENPYIVFNACIF